MKKLSNKGFTLVELIIVIAILAIIMLIAIPNFSGIQQRMQVRADKSTAAQIGKAVRIWYTEYNSDPSFKASVPTGSEVPTGAGGTLIPLFNIANIDGYVDKTLLPTSLRKADGTTDTSQMYYVGLVGAGTYEKVVVSIAGGGTPTINAAGKITAASAPTSPKANLVLPTVNADGTSTLDSKSSPKYDGSCLDSVAEGDMKFELSLAYMEP